MIGINLSDVQRELASDGFAVRAGSLRDVEIASIVQHGWKQATQKGGAGVSTLRPTDRVQAPARTLSAVHGLGAQPLHTDGAHLWRMPDVIVLYAVQPNSTAKVVWKLNHDYPSALLTGVFTVRGNERSFLAHALVNQRLRFDPVCMSPADQLAKEAKAFLEDARADAHAHSWNSGETLLFIDNRTALHGREAVFDVADAESRVLERATYHLEPL